MWMLLILAAAVAVGQTPQTIFPDDTQDPIKAGGAELLEVVCPGKVAVNAGQELACQVPCPSFTGFSGDELDWRVSRIVRGHFLSPSSEDAALAMSGCEPHSRNFGGAILLSRISSEWKVQWYRAGVPIDKCHKVVLPTKREALICLGDYGGQGFVSTELYFEDLQLPKEALMAGGSDGLMVLQDTVGNCGYNPQDETKLRPIKREFVSRVKFQTQPDGSLRGIYVYAQRGSRQLTPTEARLCDEQFAGRAQKKIDFIPAIKPYRVDFAFDGKTFRRVTR